MKDFALFNDTFSITKTSTYHLSILLKPSGLSYTIVDTVRDKCVAIKNITFNDLKGAKDYLDRIADFLKKDSFLAKNYKSVDFVYSSRKSTLVPLELFDKKLLKSYFTFVHTLDEYEEIHFNKLSKSDAVNIFSIPSDITTLMVNHFPELKFYHQTTTFIDNTIDKSSSENQLVGIMVYLSYFDITVCNSGKLFLYNNFEFQNENDFVYHIVNIYQQLKISDQKTKLFLSGEIDKEDAKYKLLSKFLKNINFFTGFDNSKQRYQFKEIPEHYLTNLINFSK
ncbi:MAG: DUF3822 family protein [Bacteroidales bacterium]